MIVPKRISGASALADSSSPPSPNLCRHVRSRSKFPSHGANSDSVLALRYPLNNPRLHLKCGRNLVASFAGYLYGLVGQLDPPLVVFA
jgi:hypothetical protein